MKLVSLLFFGASIAAVGCGESPPDRTLRQIMMRSQILHDSLSTGLYIKSTVRESDVAAGELTQWLDDPVWDDYLGQLPPQDREAFREQHDDFRVILARLVQALEGGDLDGARGEFPTLEAACVRCHEIFRPGLPGPLSGTR